MQFVGDVIFGRYRPSGYSPIVTEDVFVFEQVQPLLAGDLAVANLETPLVRELPAKARNPTGYFFGATPETAAQLKTAGFDAVSIANNHAFDLGREGLEQTPAILAELGVLAVGRAAPAEEPWRIETYEAKGTRIALIGITTLLNFTTPASYPKVPFARTQELPTRLEPLVTQATSTHDLVVVLVHWGTEYVSRASQKQRDAAHALVDLGVDLVIGHHPHVLGELEVYQGGLIAYSLGNFLFENLRPIPKLTGVLDVEFSGRGRCEARVDFHPLELVKSPTFHPQPATQASAQRIRRLLVPHDPEHRWGNDPQRIARQYRRCE